MAGMPAVKLLCGLSSCGIIIPSRMVLFFVVPRRSKDMNNDVRKLTDGAMMTAIIGVVMLIDRQMAGTLSSMLLFLFPLPMVFYAAKYGMKDSWIVLAAVILLTMIVGTPQSLFYVSIEAVIGLIYGAGVHDGLDSRKLLLRTLIPAGLLEVLAMVVFASFFGYDPAAELAEYQKIISTALDSAGQQLPANVNVTGTLKTMLLLSTILTGVMEGFITHVMSRFMLKRLRMTVPKSTPMYLYFPPKWTGYAGMACLLMYYYSILRPVDNEIRYMFMQGVGFSGVIYLIVFGIIGISVTIRLRYPALRRTAGLLIFMLVVFSMWAVAVAGFLYITTDMHQSMVQGVYSDASESK